MTSLSRYLKNAILICALALTGCAKNDALQNAVYGSDQPGSPQDFSVNVGDRVFFENDQSELTNIAQETLTKQARWLKQYGTYAFTIEGHADEQGTREYNFALGQRRAATVRDFLAARGLAVSRMKTISFGKERPVATCNDETCWSQNRRAVIVLRGGQS